MAWLGRVPRALIALVLVLAVLALHYGLPFIDLRPVMLVKYWLNEVLPYGALFIAGAVQRRNKRQILAMVGAGVAVFGFVSVLNLIAPPNTPLLLRAWRAALIMMMLGVVESYLDACFSRRTLFWMVVACLAATAVFDGLIFVLQLFDRQLFFTFITTPWGWVPLSGLVYWPWMALAGWTAISLAEAAGSEQESFLRPTIAIAGVAAWGGLAWFYQIGVYPLAERSVAGDGPFPRVTGAQLLELRGRDTDFALLAQQIAVDGKDQDIPELPDFMWRKRFSQILAKHRESENRSPK